MKAVVEFLRQLHAHSERAWFEAHRAEWLQLQERVRSFAEGLIEGIASFDPSVEGLTAKDCTYRIYRDVRFSRDKSPYKTWQGIYVAPHGKKAGYAGYYFHLEGAAEEGLVGSHMLFSGLHMPHPTVLRSVREEILDNGAEFVGNIRRAEGFALDESQRLRRTPAGFPTDSPYDELLRLKEVALCRPFGDDFPAGDDLLERTLAEFRKTAPFVQQLNRAVQYAYEEMM